MSSTPTNEPLHWMTEVGVPPEDVQFLRLMGAYQHHRPGRIARRIQDIQDAAYEALLSASLLRAYPTEVSQ